MVFFIKRKYNYHIQKVFLPKTLTFQLTMTFNGESLLLALVNFNETFSGAFSKPDFNPQKKDLHHRFSLWEQISLISIY